jgi:hypothetical protein
MRATFLLAIACGLCLAASAAEPDDLARGDALYRAWKRDEAFAAYEAAAQAGSKLALYKLGQMRLHGEGVAKDERQGEAEVHQAAEAGVPQAQHALAWLVWKMEIVEALGYGDRREKDPAAPDEPFTLEALAWEKRAAASWLREGDPYEACRIYCDLANDNTFNRYKHLKATPAALEEILPPILAYPIDRPALLKELQAAKPGEARALEILKLLMLPTRKPAVLPLDLDDTGIFAILASPLPDGGTVTAVCGKRKGRYGMCGTGRSPGGVKAPDLDAAQPVDHIIGLNAGGVPFFQYRSGRDRACLYDADGDGRAAELLVYDGGYDYNRAPHLAIYDLSLPGAPLMAALTFNYYEHREETVFEEEEEPKTEAAGDEAEAPRIRSVHMRRILKPMLEGSWRFEPRAGGYRDLRIEWSEGGAPRQQVIPYNASARRWETPAESGMNFWRSGLLGDLQPVLRFEP